ncbi:MAG: Tad domain-containing protein, partial [Anaerolineae bacterium]|nr:Tad domain-containing protein [Anaerolineae bacterium]
MSKQHSRSASTPRTRRAESGQAIVIIAFLMIGLIGMLGLAVDGGGLFFLQRDTQNASDAAVVAATYAKCTSGDPIIAGYQAATENGFTNGDGRSAVTVSNPPTRGVAAGDSDYVEVEITATKPSYFIQLVYPGPLQVTTYSVGFCSPPFDPTTVPALFSISQTCGNTIDWTGSSVRIEGGMHSNNEIKIGGGGGGNDIYGDVSLVDSATEDSNTDWWAADDGDPSTPDVPQAPVTNASVREDPLPFRLQDYQPGGSTARAVALYTYINSGSGDSDWMPGGGGTWKPSNGRVLEGLYYVEGDVDIGTNVILDGDRNGDGRAEGVSIVATGSIQFNAGSGMNVHYYADGLIAFSDDGEGRPCSYNAVLVSGSSATWYGLIYAPHGAVQGSLSSMTVIGAIVANTMNMSGSDLDLI